jgi:hypothetical protein
VGCSFLGRIGTWWKGNWGFYWEKIGGSGGIWANLWNLKVGR